MTPSRNWILGAKHGLHPSGQDTFSAGIFPTLRFPFPRSHSLEDPSTKGCGKNQCKYCYFWATVSKSLMNIVMFTRFRRKLLENHCNYCYFWATLSKNLVNIIMFARFRPTLLENHCKYCYFWATVSKNLVNIVVLHIEVIQNLVNIVVLRIEVAQNLINIVVLRIDVTQNLVKILSFCCSG